MKLLKKTEKAEQLVDIEFTVYKFNNRHKPKDKRKIMIVSCLSEFGCETLGCLFCIPRISQDRPGMYKIAVGWYGREYFYRHLVDEFWEIKEDYQWLRDYCRAFHHKSKNLKKLELKLKDYGQAIPSEFLGKIVVGNRCKTCNNFWGDINYVEECPKCKHKDIIRSLFGDLKSYRDSYTPIPTPSDEKLKMARGYLKPNAVGIFARGRKTYGRNLQPEFYVELIEILEAMGYNPIWLGEKQTTLPCPVDHIVDFSRLPECKDLELTCAIVKNLEFTIQFWTASSRLSAMMGTPYLIVESPMQIWGDGQEGYRLSLMKNMAPKKIAICHFLNVLNDHNKALEVIRQCVGEMEQKNYKTVIGMVENRTLTEQMRMQNKKRIDDD
jgi:hypothetical protein